MLHTAIAHRAASPKLPGSASDWVRTFDDSDATIALMANAFDSGFATCWPQGSAILLDAWVDAWRSGSGSPSCQRTANAFSAACRRFRKDARVPYDDPDLDIGLATLVTVVANPTQAHVVWIGGDHVVQVRDGRTLWSSRPDTWPVRLLERGATEHAARMPNVLTRMIGQGDDEPSVMTLALRPGDRIVLVSKSFGAGSDPTIERLDARSAWTLSRQELADTAVDLAVQIDDAPFANAAVIEVE